jgi:predicted DNA-binding protein
MAPRTRFPQQRVFNLSAEQDEALVRAAEETGSAIAEVLREALNRHLVETGYLRPKRVRKRP